jgi:hypothetical protein
MNPLDRPLFAEFDAAWNAFAAHNRYFMENTPLGEPTFSAWKRDSIPLIDRVKAAMSNLRNEGYCVYKTDDGKGVVVRPFIGEGDPLPWDPINAAP